MKLPKNYHKYFFLKSNKNYYYLKNINNDKININNYKIIFKS